LHNEHVVHTCKRELYNFPVCRFSVPAWLLLELPVNMSALSHRTLVSDP
jgi:hypothetical protein